VEELSTASNPGVSFWVARCFVVARASGAAHRVGRGRGGAAASQQVAALSSSARRDGVVRGADASARRGCSGRRSGCRTRKRRGQWRTRCRYDTRALAHTRTPQGGVAEGEQGGQGHPREQQRDQRGGGSPRSAGRVSHRVPHSVVWDSVLGHIEACAHSVPLSDVVYRRSGTHQRTPSRSSSPVSLPLYPSLLTL
jgi:hypothetical protein